MELFRRSGETGVIQNAPPGGGSLVQRGGVAGGPVARLGFVRLRQVGAVLRRHVRPFVALHLRFKLLDRHPQLLSKRLRCAYCPRLPQQGQLLAVKLRPRLVAVGRRLLDQPGQHRVGGVAQQFGVGVDELVGGQPRIGL